MHGIGAEQQWFLGARYGMFIHWGPYSIYGRGEQVLYREYLDQRTYEKDACAWNPTRFDPKEWADIARRGGFRYAVLTTRHHDGYCLWDSQVTDYTSMQQAPGRDFVAEYVDTFRSAGLKVGLYYSLADWRIPAYWIGPDEDPAGFAKFRDYVHEQVQELCTNYGKIDVLWFDGAWPWNADQWRSTDIMKSIRTLQPGCLVNNRLDITAPDNAGTPDIDKTSVPGDFGTPEHHITAEGRPWESCNTSTWRLWGYTHGERWRDADVLLDMLLDTTVKGGNLLMNVGPHPEGPMPEEFIERSDAIGQWLETHGESVFGTQAGEVCEFVTYGKQTRKDNVLYLIIRFWPGRSTLRLAGLKTRVKSITFLTTKQSLDFEQTADAVTIHGLPEEPPTALFPVIKVTCEDLPEPCDWARNRLWGAEAWRMADWAKRRGEGVCVNGTWREAAAELATP